MKSSPARASLYWFDPEPVRGSELRKVLPCIVVSPDVMNTSLRTVIIVPLTTTVRPWPFRLTLKVLGQRTRAACDQIRAVDTSRLKAYIGDLSKKDATALFTLLHTIFAD